MTTEEEKKKEEEKKSGWSGGMIFMAICLSLLGILGLFIVIVLIRKLLKKHDPNKPARWSYEGEARHAAKTCSFLR